jgi:hypothetical protein
MPQGILQLGFTRLDLPAYQRSPEDVELTVALSVGADFDSRGFELGELIPVQHLGRR